MSQAPFQKFTAKKKNSVVKEEYRQEKKKVRAEVKKVKMYIAKAKKNVLLAEKKIETHAQKNPMKALAIAAGVGAVLGATAAALIKKKK